MTTTLSLFFFTKKTKVKENFNNEKDAFQKRIRKIMLHRRGNQFSVGISKEAALIENDTIEKFSVDARILHKGIEVRKQYTDCNHSRIKSYKFIKNVDFKPFTPKW